MITAAAIPSLMDAVAATLVLAGLSGATGALVLGMTLDYEFRTPARRIALWCALAFVAIVAIAIGIGAFIYHASWVDYRRGVE